MTSLISKPKLQFLYSPVNTVRSVKDCTTVENGSTTNVRVSAVGQNTAPLQGNLERQGIRGDFTSAYNLVNKQKINNLVK